MATDLFHNIGFGGRRLPNFKIPALPQGRNPVKQFVPVARIADVVAPHQANPCCSMVTSLFRQSSLLFIGQAAIRFTITRI